jgi:hypothetical protein
MLGIEIMPTNWECQSCHLTFTVGWYHYHDFSSGYSANTRLVCKRCGTMHAIEHATTLAPHDKVENKVSAPDLSPEQKPDRLLAQPVPLFVNMTEQQHAANSDNMLDQLLAGLPKLRDWVQCSASRSIRPERVVRPIPTVEACTDKLMLKDVTCNYCGEIGSLVSRWHDNECCPRCGGPVIITGNWIT